MPRYAAFLRGINLGRRRVTNDQLAEAFDGPGVSNVAPFLASGNVVFGAELDAPAEENGQWDFTTRAGSDGAGALERTLARRLEAALGFEVATFLRSLDRLAEIAELSPPPAAAGDGFNVHVIFLGSAPDAGIERALRELETEDDVLEVHDREVLWYRRGRLSDSPIRTADLERALGGIGNTMRNMNTVRRIVAKFGAGA